MAVIAGKAVIYSLSKPNDKVQRRTTGPAQTGPGRCASVAVERSAAVVSAHG